MFPLERQDAFPALTSDIHPQLTSLTTCESADNFTWEAHEPDMALGKLICSGLEITHLLSTCQAPIPRSRLCPTEITSDKIKLKCISAPICFQWFCPFRTTSSVELHLPSLAVSHGTLHQGFQGFASLVPCFWGICPILGAAALVWNGEQLGPVLYKAQWSYGAASKHWPQGKGAGRGSQAL